VSAAVDEDGEQAAVLWLDVFRLGRRGNEFGRVHADGIWAVSHHPAHPRHRRCGLHRHLHPHPSEQRLILN